MKLNSVLQRLIGISLIDGNVGRSVYLPSYMDNRGRLYYGTLISPTFYKLFRNLYVLSNEKKFDDPTKSRFYREMIKYKTCVGRFNVDDFRSYILIILFIEVGKHFMKGGDGYIVRTEKIIELGIDNYIEKNRNIEFEDLLYMEKIYYQLDNILIKDLIDENLIILKDATASGLQNYGILLGYRLEKLKYLNLNGEDWCDTYKYIIDLFLEQGPLSKRKY
jgi:hypothetical protein